MLTYRPQTILGYRKDGRPIRVIAGGDDSTPPSTTPSLADLVALAGGGSISTTGPDVWGTSNYGDLSVNVGSKQTGGPTGFLASVEGGKLVKNPQSAVDTNPGTHFEARQFTTKRRLSTTS